MYPGSYFNACSTMSHQGTVGDLSMYTQLTGYTDVLKCFATVGADMVLHVLVVCWIRPVVGLNRLF